MDISAILKENQVQTDWTVKSDGSMFHEGNGYFIDSRCLSENWLAHLQEKNWINMNTFVPAYLLACSKAGVSSVSVSYND